MVLASWQKIKQKQFSPLYLVYGREQFLINETKQLIVDNVLRPDEQQFNLAIYDLEEVPIEIALEEAETAPFFGEQRLIILQKPVFLTAAKQSTKIEHNVEQFLTYINSPSPTAIIVILAPYEKLDERRKITKQLKKHATVVEVNKLSDSDIKMLITEKLQLHNVKMDSEAIQLLRNLVEDNLLLLMSELEKLSLYVGEGNSITSVTVEKLVVRSLEQNIFSLVDKVVKRQLDSAFQIYFDLLKQNEEPIKILAILAGQFRLIYQAKELSRLGYGERQIASYLKVHPYRIKLVLGQIGYFTEEELAKIIDLLTESDYAMKTGLMEKKLVVEMFLFKLNQLI